MQRIDQLSDPPVVGRRYLVPTVLGNWGLTGDTRDWWPVWGPLHNDVEHFSFHYMHYHVDRRFVATQTLAHHAVATPMAINEHINQTGFPAPAWRVRMCRRDTPWFPDALGSVALQGAFAGHQCKRGKAGWICPHRNFALGSISQDAQGVIHCPLHGLQIDAASGVVLQDRSPTFSVDRFRSDPTLY